MVTQQPSEGLVKRREVGERSSALASQTQGIPEHTGHEKYAISWSQVTCTHRASHFSWVLGGCGLGWAHIVIPMFEMGQSQALTGIHAAQVTRWRPAASSEHRDICPNVI